MYYRRRTQNHYGNKKNHQKLSKKIKIKRKYWKERKEGEQENPKAKEKEKVKWDPNQD